LNTTSRIDVSLWHRRGFLACLAMFAIMAIALGSTSSWNARGAAVLAVASLVAGCVLVVTIRLHRTPSWSLLSWPVLALLTETVLGFTNPEGANLVLGVFVMSFLFVGITQPPHRSFWLVGPAAASFVSVVDMPWHEEGIRLILAVSVWLLVAEIPARLFTRLDSQRTLLEVSARTDPLTGVRNRQDLDKTLAAIDASASVALIDLDHFKPYNDEYGHLCGDEVLRRFGAMLTAGTRPRDLLFRYGGEEFLLVLPETTTPDARTLLRRLSRAWAGDDSGLTFSAGVAPGGPHAVARADRALYAAKAAGRDRIDVELEAMPPTPRGVGGTAAARR
jgi:diguanylate cyclase (GGDEF)-like protein